MIAATTELLRHWFLGDLSQNVARFCDTVALVVRQTHGTPMLGCKLPTQGSAGPSVRSTTRICAMTDSACYPAIV
jgi:hypothetical protein